MRGAFWIRVGAILGFVGVGAGAFGAHGLRSMLNEPAMNIYETAVRYQMYHALALLGVGILIECARPAGRAACVAGWAFLAGIVVFSGSLYALAITGERWLGAITPFGGVAFLVGWVALALAASSAKPGEAWS